jgi:hypothetical protein
LFALIVHIFHGSWDNFENEGQIMERIGVYKASPWLAKFFVVFGSIVTLLGVSLLIKSLIAGFNIHFPSGDWNSVTFTIQGILFILFGYSNLKSRRYYIEWDNDELRFLLPGNKKTETIRFDQIRSVNIRLFEIELILESGVKILNLDNLQFGDLKKIKLKFESINQKNK